MQGLGRYATYRQSAICFDFDFVMSMFKKPKKNFRRRVVDDSDDEKPNDGVEPMDIEDQNQETSVPDIPQIPKEKTKIKKPAEAQAQPTKKSKSNILLSFDHDPEEDGTISLACHSFRPLINMVVGQIMHTRGHDLARGSGQKNEHPNQAPGQGPSPLSHSQQCVRRPPRFRTMPKAKRSKSP
jgi:hypothetical protein